MILRQSTENFSVFKTFDTIRPLSHIDIESESGDSSLLEKLPESGLAIVGTRYPQIRSVQLLEKTIAGLRGTGLIIVSGLARGIDSRAHELAIEYGLKTIAILGCGIDLQYPLENSHLRKKIIQSGGLVLSQFERSTPPYAGNFLIRNRLVAGMSKAVWVVEAAEISGTLNTANHANQCGRDVYATSSFPGDHFYLGNEKLIAQSKSEKFTPAHPFFNTQSLGTTWPGRIPSPSPRKHGFKPKTQIQKWVLELSSRNGECHLQTLMSHASSQGFTLGNFYLQFEEEIASGSLTQDEQGRINVFQIP